MSQSSIFKIVDQIDLEMQLDHVVQLYKYGCLQIKNIEKILLAKVLYLK